MPDHHDVVNTISGYKLRVGTCSPHIDSTHRQTQHPHTQNIFRRVIPHPNIGKPNIRTSITQIISVCAAATSPDPNPDPGANTEATTTKTRTNPTERSLL